MARILVGIMGDAGGHLTQVLAVVQAMPHHEYLFVGGGTVLGLRELGYTVEEIPMPSTFYANNRVDVWKTVRNGVGVLFNKSRIVDRVVRVAEEFGPHLAMTSYECFTPLVARRLGIPCMSLDNQHFLTKCRCRLPKGQTLSRLAFSLPLRSLYSGADFFLINAFYGLEPLDESDTAVFPPILRKAVVELEPTDGSHVLVYQTSPTFERLAQVLNRLDSPCLVYGFGERPNTGNVIFKPHSGEDFLKDMASCRYFVTNGGHTAISEALYYGKPVLSFPIHLAYEQFFNAHMIESLGYGAYSLDPKPDLDVFRNMEARLGEFRSRIAEGEFYGNDAVVAWIEQFLQDR